MPFYVPTQQRRRIVLNYTSAAHVYVYARLVAAAATNTIVAHDDRVRLTYSQIYNTDAADTTSEWTTLSHRGATSLMVTDETTAVKCARVSEREFFKINTRQATHTHSRMFTTQ